MNMDVVLDTVMELIYEDNGGGICTACYEVMYGVEPDGENYECEACGEFKVLGAELYLLMNVA